MKYSVILLIPSLFFAACGKDDKEPTKTEILTASAWKFESGGIDQDKNGSVDVPFSSGLLPACYFDNTGTFYRDETGISDEGPDKCPNAPQTTPFTWKFSNNETMITIGGAGVLGTGGQFRILELTSTRFGMAKDTSVSGFNMSMIVYLKH